MFYLLHFVRERVFHTLCCVFCIDILIFLYYPISVKSLCVPTERMMYMPKRITVTHESNTGRNERFHDNFTGANMTRNQFVNQIKQGNYENYHVRNINGVPTPVSNPDKTRNNNLG